MTDNRIWYHSHQTEKSVNMKRTQRETMPKKALMYFKDEKILCVTPLKYKITS